MLGRIGRRKVEDSEGQRGSMPMNALKLSFEMLRTSELSLVRSEEEALMPGGHAAYP